MFRSKAEQKVRDAGYAPARLPPGQYLTEKWPVLHAGRVPETDLATWDFRVFGEVEEPVTLNWRELAKLVRPKPSAHFVLAHAEQNFTANVPLSAMEDDEALIAYEADGEPLTPDHGWPLRLVVPRRYFWKSAKWLRGIELLDSDQPGFWERYGYHNNADYSKEERYSF